MVPSPFDDRRDVDVTDVVAAVGLACCVGFGGFALLDQIANTDVWPPGAEYGPGLFGFVSLYWAFLRRLAARERAISVSLLTFAVSAMVVAAYTNPEGLLTPLALVALLAAFAYGGGHVARSLGTSRSTGH